MTITGLLAVTITGLLGGAWRRWMGQEMTGFLAHRWVKLAVAALFGFGVAYYWTQDPYVAAAVSLVTTAGWTPAAQFGKVDDHVAWALIPRYGLVTLAAAVAAFVVSRQTGGDLMPFAYAPVGMLAPAGYKMGVWSNFRCWTCVGEFGLGVLVYGGMFLLHS